MTSTPPNPPGSITRGYFHIIVGTGSLTSAATKLMKNDNFTNGCLIRADELQDASDNDYILAPFAATDVAGLQSEVANEINSSSPTITQASVTKYHSGDDSGLPNQGNSCPDFDDDEIGPLTGGSNRWG
ncbi:MAG: hypothetical protein QF898_02665 [SAR202 cluster bacterium]|nr:hypothetical protein [SAR202 cluster bacterium]MDP6713422.1 hypothetical protein [SAR202 cluster bacterium]